MATIQETQKALEKVEQTKSLRTLIEQSTKEIGRALPRHMSPERVVRVALTCIRLNPELGRCTPESFLGSLFVLAQLGLEPIAGRSYLLPFNNKRKIGNEWKTYKEVQALIGYKGLVELFYRHESALSIDMQTVYANDEFDYQYGTESHLFHKPAKASRGEAIGYYAVAKMKGGASVFRYMSKEDVENHAKKHSKSYGSEFSPWTKEFDAMAMKTVLIQLAKLLPLSVEMQRAIEVDETTRDFREGITDALDVPDQTNWDQKSSDPVSVAKDEPGDAQDPV